MKSLLLCLLVVSLASCTVYPPGPASPTDNSIHIDNNNTNNNNHQETPPTPSPEPSPSPSPSPVS